MEEGKLIVGGASVACVMSHRYPISVREAAGSSRYFHVYYTIDF